jgi:hypothetical protein
MNEVQKLIDENRLQEALVLANNLLDENPNDLTTLFQIGEILVLTDRLGLAFNIYKYLTKVVPERPEVWNNLGRCLQTRRNSQEARKCFQKALDLDKDNAAAMINMAVMDVNEGKHERAKNYASKALTIIPESRQARDVLAMAKLAVHDWTGWKDYRKSEGPPFRTLRQFRVPEEPEWEGEPDKTVVIYREQGLGDEILFGSCLQEAIDISKKIIVSCDKRLTGLFKRSFPKADIYGTGHTTDIMWNLKYAIDCSSPMGRLPEFFRKKNDDFVKTQGKYLVPCPLRVKAYKEMLSGFKGKKIGLAWNGGKRSDVAGRDDSVYRSLKLKDLSPLLKEGNTYISLEYKDASEEIESSGLPVLDFPWITQSNDYDDTAALVSNLDYIISVPTTVVHLAGALEIPVYCLTPEFTNWRFGNDDMIWHRSVRLFRSHGGIISSVPKLEIFLEA